MKIVIDAFGGDNSPNEIVKGAILGAEKHKKETFVLVGKIDTITDILKTENANLSQFEIVNADSVISCEDSPTESIRNKKDSSICVGFDYLKENEDAVAFVSAGSTGAVLAGALLKLGRIKGVMRPALAPFLPTKTGGQVLLIDAGANVDCKPEYLVQFAMMGDIYCREILKIEKPRIALLSVGTENNKGNLLTKTVFESLSKTSLNFVGNMEARDALSGKYDVIVCDGFDGNVLLKSVEGACKTLMGEVKNTLLSSFLTKFGALFLKKPLKEMAKKYDYEKYGGSPFLGAKKTVIKAHGSSKSGSILSAIDQAIAIEEFQINNKINEKLMQIEE